MADCAPYKVVLKNVNTQLDDKVVLLLRVVRRWNVHSKGNSSEPYMIEMVLIDEEETRIQATIENAHVSTFKDKNKEHGLICTFLFYMMHNAQIQRPESFSFLS